MDYINLATLLERQEKIRGDFNAKQVFRYVVIEDFFKADQATHILQSYPDLTQGTWDGTTYIDQKTSFSSALLKKIRSFMQSFQS